MRIIRALAYQDRNDWFERPVMEFWLLSEPGTAASVMATALARRTLQLLAALGMPAGFSHVDTADDEQLARLVLEYDDEPMTLACLDAAGRVERGEGDEAAELERLRTIARRSGLGGAASAVIRSARDRGIPLIRFDGFSFLQLGQGCHRRRYWLVETDGSSAVGSSIAKDKQLAKYILRAAGVPVPDGRPVDDADDAVAAARALGSPVVVKPQDGSRGRGVSVGLTTDEQVRAAYDGARAISEDIMVERHAEGEHFRLLVVGGRFTAAIHRTVSAGNDWFSTDVTDRVHPAVGVAAERAAAAVGLDVAGLDVVARTIEVPLEGQGVVVEVNSGPGLRMHESPDAGTPRPVGRAVVDALMPPGQAGRVPVVAVTGDADTTAVARLVATLLGAAGRTAGAATSHGVEVAGQPVVRGVLSAVEGARDVFLHPEVELAVLEASTCGILSEGVGFDRCEVAVVTAPDPSLSPRDAARALRLVASTLAPGACLVAEANLSWADELARAGTHRIVYGLDAAAVAGAGTPRTLYLDGPRLVFSAGESSREVDLGAPATLDLDPAACRILLAAAAAAWGLGVSPDEIVDGLAAQPGRACALAS